MSNYHTETGNYVHNMGIVEGGNMALLAGAGQMVEEAKKHGVDILLIQSMTITIKLPYLNIFMVKYL